MAITRYDAKAESGEMTFYIQKEGGIGWPGVGQEQTLKEMEEKTVVYEAVKSSSE